VQANEAIATAVIGGPARGASHDFRFAGMRSMYSVPVVQRLCIRSGSDHRHFSCASEHCRSLRRRKPQPVDLVAALRAKIADFLCPVLIVLLMFGPVSAMGQECPTAQSGKRGFVVERGDQQKTEVFHDDGGIVRTITRYNGKPVLETTQYEGLFQLDRLDNGRRTKFEAQSELKQLFPLKPGQKASAAFLSESDGRTGQLRVDIAVKREDALYIGPCKYAVLVIERSESRSTEPPKFVDTDYYSQQLKLILAKEYRNTGAPAEMIKFDRIYPLNR
jgi:hypothetical protein